MDTYHSILLLQITAPITIPPLYSKLTFQLPPNPLLILHHKYHNHWSLHPRVHHNSHLTWTHPFLHLAWILFMLYLYVSYQAMQPSSCYEFEILTICTFLLRVILSRMGASSSRKVPLFCNSQWLLVQGFRWRQNWWWETPPWCCSHFRAPAQWEHTETPAFFWTHAFA